MRPNRNRPSVRTGLAGVVVVAAMLTAPASAATASVEHDRIVDDTPSANTPWINDGRVFDIAHVGGVVVAGGNFTSVSAAGGAPSYERSGIVAFDASTGAIVTGFDPQINGAVNALLPGPVPGSVLVGGAFNTVNGEVVRALALLDVATGERITSFDGPFFNGAVNDLDVHGDRLYVGGIFKAANGVQHGGLAALDFSSGAIDHDFLLLPVAESHNYDGSGAQGPVGVRALSVSPDGTHLAVVGNFRKVGGLDRRQAALVDVAGPVAEVADWRTRRYEPRCAWGAYDTYVRDVDFAPDGSFFAIATTGGPYPGTLCDTAAAWPSDARGDNLQPMWIDETGGDTLWSTEVTGSAVYVGGHQRWQNNTGGRDNPQPGSVPRPGLGAIDPVAGVPLSWNPGVNPRGAGVFALVSTDDGLWMGNDREWLGVFEYRRPRIAFFPTATGTTPPAGETAGLPGSVYIGGQAFGAGLQRRSYDGASAAGPTEPVDGGGIDWSSVRGGFQVDGTFFYGTLGGTFHRRTFDGESFGPAAEVDPYRDPKWCDVSSGSGGYTYCGRLPSFYNDLRAASGMAFHNGRLYYTRSGSSTLFRRDFSPESGIVGVASAVSGVSMPQVMGMFIADDQLYYASSVDGSLWRRPMGPDGPTGSAARVSGFGIDWLDWRGRALFTASAGEMPAQEPVASFEVACTGLDCSFDASAATDPDGEIVGYDWDFGDGTSGTGVAPAHSYAAGGTYDVTLTVTDDDGLSGSERREIFVAGDGGIEFRAAAAAAQHTASPAVAIPDTVEAGDGLLLFASINKDGIDVTTPDGWSVVAEQSAGGQMLTVLYEKVAGPSDAGSTVTVPLSALSKADLTVLAYSGAGGGEVVAQVASAADGPTSNSHTTPAVTIEADGSLVVSYWADKSSVVTDWTAPEGEHVRSESIGSASGRITSLATDPGAPVGAGTAVGELTASTDEPAPRATMWTVVIGPG